MGAAGGGGCDGKEEMHMRRRYDGNRWLMVLMGVLILFVICLVGHSVFQMERLTDAGEKALASIGRYYDNRDALGYVAERRDVEAEVEKVMNSTVSLSTFVELLTVLLTLATIIPFVISSTVSKRDLEKMFREQFDQQLDKYHLSMSSIVKSDGHNSRMIGKLLYLQEQKVWAAGWAAQALMKYLQMVYEENGKTTKEEFYNMSVEMITSCFKRSDKDKLSEDRLSGTTVDESTSSRSDKDSNDTNTLLRTFVDTFDMLAYYSYSVYANRHNKVRCIDNNLDALKDSLLGMKNRLVRLYGEGGQDWVSSELSSRSAVPDMELKAGWTLDKIREQLLPKESDHHGGQKSD